MSSVSGKKSNNDNDGDYGNNYESCKSITGNDGNHAGDGNHNYGNGNNRSNKNSSNILKSVLVVLSK